MIKVAVVMPYRELLDTYKECINRIASGREIDFEINNIKGTRDNFIKECKADIVVARGITSVALRREMHKAHFIDIEVTGYDIFNAIIKCKTTFNCDNIGIIVTESVLCDIDSLKQISHSKLSVFQVQDEMDILKSLKQGKSIGIGAFIGGTTAAKICEEEGINFIGIQVGKEAVENSIRLAVDAAESINKERGKAILMKKVLDSSKNGVISLNKKGYVEEINLKAREIFEIPLDNPVEKISLEKMFPKAEWKDVIQRNIPRDLFFKLNDILYVINMSPIYVDDAVDGILITVENSEQVRETETKIRTKLRKKGLVAKYTFDNILGESDAIKQAKNMAKKYSEVNSNVLIVGETGTGKELFAHSIHNASKRRLDPFVAINCAAVPENLLESELFGYSEGAFSGAVRGGKIGLFELAHGGTIFLDEIGEMPLNLQAKILRVLEEKEIRRVGDDKVMPVDVRVISATNINIQKRIMQGLFRADLYYRLNLLDITVAPLRNRKIDIPILVKNFIQKAAKKNDIDNIIIDEKAIIELCKWTWSGNVRQLRNICERLVVISENNHITETDVKSMHISNGDFFDFDDEQEGIRFSQKCLDDISCMKKADLAKALGISRTTLWRRMKETNT